MKLDDEGLEYIKTKEGLPEKNLQPFSDPSRNNPNLMSIGYGHQIKPGEHFTKITPNEASELLKKDVKWAENAVNNQVKVPITQKMFNKLVDFTVNLGAGNKIKPTIGRITGILNSGAPNAYNEAGKKIQEFSGGPPAALAGLAVRRKEESAPFFAGIPPPQQGKAILATQKQTEDNKAAKAQNTGQSAMINAPSNTQVNNTSIIAQQHDPRNIDDTYKNTQQRDRFSM